MNKLMLGGKGSVQEHLLGQIVGSATGYGHLKYLLQEAFYIIKTNA
jgi:hypothetical protein